VMAVRIHCESEGDSVSPCVRLGLDEAAWDQPSLEASCIPVKVGSLDDRSPHPPNLPAAWKPSAAGRGRRGSVRDQKPLALTLLS
jgi:hypothetical protein